MNQALRNWTRAYDWQRKRQGDEPAVLMVEHWRVPLWWRVLHRLGAV